MPSSCSRRRRGWRATLFPYTPLFRSVFLPAVAAALLLAPAGFEWAPAGFAVLFRSEEHTSELQSLRHLVCRLLVQGAGEGGELLSFPTRRSSDLSFCRRSRPPCSWRRRALNGPRPVLLCSSDRKSTRLNSSHLGISYAVFLFKAPARVESYSLSLHAALPICLSAGGRGRLALGAGGL